MKTVLYSFLLNYLLLSGASVSFAVAPPFVKWTDAELTLNNGLVQRTIKLPASNGPFLTTSYKPVTGDFRYFGATSPDFQFAVNGVSYSGSSDWKQIGIQRVSDAKQGDGAAVTLQSKDGKIELTVQFLLYPDLPVIRKRLTVKNLTNERVSLESVDVETFAVTAYYATTFSWICHDYGRGRSIGPYDGNFQDALLTVHNSNWQQGIVIGNEAAGVIKHTSVFWEESAIRSGLTGDWIIDTKKFPHGLKPSGDADKT